MRLLVVVGLVAVLLGVLAGVVHARSEPPHSPAKSVVVKQVVTSAAPSGGDTATRGEPQRERALDAAI